MPFCRKRPNSLFAWLAAALLGLWLGLSLGQAQAAEIEPQRASLAFSEDAVLVDADFTLELSTRLEDIVNHGVPMHFVLEFELVRPRWYWLNEVEVEKSRIYRLTYHALTRQYRLYSGSLYQSFATLPEALGILSRVRSWHVADRGQLKPGENYQAAVRLRLDWAQLPKPLQITAIASREWNLGVDWRRWTVTVPQAGVVPQPEAK
ncbi:MAG: DUF4390 domain-containing protein [Rhodocyclaceae bacterium]|nr:DUF4390 domain-containing protein [Rhodocyclaceae bacterium]